MRMVFLFLLLFELIITLSHAQKHFLLFLFYLFLHHLVFPFDIRLLRIRDIHTRNWNVHFIIIVVVSISSVIPSIFRLDLIHFDEEGYRQQKYSKRDNGVFAVPIRRDIELFWGINNLSFFVFFENVENCE